MVEIRSASQQGSEESTPWQGTAMEGHGRAVFTNSQWMPPRGGIVRNRLRLNGRGSPECSAADVDEAVTTARGRLGVRRHVASTDQGGDVTRWDLEPRNHGLKVLCTRLEPVETSEINGHDRWHMTDSPTSGAVDSEPRVNMMMDFDKSPPKGDKAQSRRISAVGRAVVRDERIVFHAISPTGKFGTRRVGDLVGLVAHVRRRS